MIYRLKIDLFTYFQDKFICMVSLNIVDWNKENLSNFLLILQRGKANLLKMQILC